MNLYSGFLFNNVFIKDLPKIVMFQGGDRMDKIDFLLSLRLKER